ncbi:hypothetical protein H6A19_08015 [Clostridium saudiense]|uniref:Lipoprotein n=1 Tax=Clostridium saudiense TaxID=1414720 RepID=A0ABS2FGE3_9CLOT|nr:hypothetical protein [Clostridium saudiense]MBM6819279.1 hypothetical protein [Clostridium saudiense]
MRKLKKYILVLFLIMSMVFILIGCGEAKISSDTSINIDGTSNTKIKIYYDDTINKLVDNDLLSKVITEVKDKIPDKIHFGEIIKSKEGSLNTEEVDISTDKVKLNEVSNLSSDYFSIIEVEDKGIFENEYEVTFKLKDSVIDIISDYINNNINNNLGLDLGTLINKNIANLVGDIPVNLSISMPVKIVDTNSKEIVGDKTVKYSYTINDLNENNSIMIGFNVPNISNIVIVLVVIIVIIFISIIYYVKRRKK